SLAVDRDYVGEGIGHPGVRNRQSEELHRDDFRRRPGQATFAAPAWVLPRDPARDGPVHRTIVPRPHDGERLDECDPGVGDDDGGDTSGFRLGDYRTDQAPELDIRHDDDVWPQPRQEHTRGVAETAQARDVPGHEHQRALPDRQPAQPPRYERWRTPCPGRRRRVGRRDVTGN